MQPSRLDKLSDGALKQLRNHSYLRTNHFEVNKALDGLDERFRVNSREDLANALVERLEKLRESSFKWEADILHLLLELSDQPTHNTRLEDLESLQRDHQDADPVAALRWEEIAREDGWDQDGELWETAEYSDISSDGPLEQQLTIDSEDTSMIDDSEHRATVASTFITWSEDPMTFDQVRAAQSWRKPTLLEEHGKSSRKVAISELHVVREVLFMLQGSQSTLFRQDCVASAHFQLDNMEWDTFRALMRDLSDCGFHLQILRNFAAVRQDVPHLQAFQDCISERLREMDSDIAAVQQQLATPLPGYVLSISRMKVELSARLKPLCALADIVSRIETEPHSTPFKYLELLFSETCLAQASGRTDIYEFLARIFAECFRVYLRPVRLWMDDGKLLLASDLFFVAESTSDIPLGKTWESKYYLRKTPEGALHCPVFLNAAASSIYNAGKNVTLLKLLGKYEAAAASQRRRMEPPLDFEAMCPPGQELVPFSELFNAAFDQWIVSKYRATSTTLKDTLFEDWALLPTLDAFRNVYLMSDGYTSSSFAASIFSKLDETEFGWADGRALTLTAQDSFASVRDPSRLSIQVDSTSMHLPSTQAPYTVKSVLGSIKVDYRLPWPLQMIVTEISVKHYQALFALLLQLKRANHALHKLKVLDNYWTDHDDWASSAMLYAARSKLLWFCTTIQTYLAILVLTPISAQLRRDLGLASSVDEMIAVHEEALKSMVSQACLGSRLAPIRECILDVFDLALALESIRSGKPDSQKDAVRESKGERLKAVKRKADAHVRFIWTGLRGVARATSDLNSVKWEILADMLQAGDGDMEDYSRHGAV